MQRKTITITDQQDTWVKSVIDSGDYGNDSEYFRDLIRHDQARRSAGSELRRLLEEAEASGFSERTPMEIWAASEARYKAQRG